MHSGSNGVTLLIHAALVCVSCAVMPRLSATPSRTWTAILGRLINALSKKKTNRNPSAPGSPRQQITKLQAENERLKSTIEDLKSDLQNSKHRFDQVSKINQGTLERYYTTFRDMPLPCFTVNEIGHIMEWNIAAEQFFGLPTAEVVDKPLAAVLGDDVFRGHAQDRIYRVFLGHKPEPAKIKVKIGTADRTVSWCTSPVKNSEGAIVGAINILGVIKGEDGA